MGLLAIFAAGAVFGPIMVAAIAALDDELDYVPPAEDQAAKLIETYEANLPSGLFFTSIYREPHVKNCGYDETELFPEGLDEMLNARRKGRFSLFEGYEAIDVWARELRDMAYIAAITDKIRQEHSPYEIEFLRRCIQSTVFSHTCMKHVATFGDRVERFPDKPHEEWYFAGSGYEEEVICTYLDGVATRRGIAIPKRD